MTYRQIVDAVLAQGFDESDRTDAQNWVQFRHSWLWDLDDWTFKYGTATVTFTAGSQTVGGLPSDFHAGVALYDSIGGFVRPIGDYREFFTSYNANLQNGTGTPEAWTVLGGTMLIGPAGDGTTGVLIYEKAKPTLSADSDSTGLPDGYDLALVHGGKAEGFKLKIVPDLAQSFDEDFTAAANALRQSYLNQVKASGSRQMGAYRPGRAWR